MLTYFILCYLVTKCFITSPLWQCIVFGVVCLFVCSFVSGSGSDNDGRVYVFQWKIFVIIASHLTNFVKCGIKYVNI